MACIAVVVTELRVVRFGNGKLFAVQLHTMEMFVHGTDPAQVLAGFFRILKPGGRIAVLEYDHNLT